MVKAMVYSYGYIGTEDLKYCLFAVLENVLKNMTDSEKINRIGFIGDEWRYPLTEITLNGFVIKGDKIIACDNFNRVWIKDKDSCCWFLKTL